MISDETWYVAIAKFFASDYYSLIGAGGENYRGFKKIALPHGIEIVAEQFGVDDSQVNRITGFDENGKRTQKNPLGELVDRLNRGEQLNAQKELTAICFVGLS
ncbi:MAG: hypothetical protein PHF67_03165 [Candidatus Nanoarchaeia archaeon]|nr:hypothetical protein [Candidatus Nanoarchaeia archaeon]